MWRGNLRSAIFQNFLPHPSRCSRFPLAAGFSPKSRALQWAPPSPRHFASRWFRFTKKYGIPPTPPTFLLFTCQPFTFATWTTVSLLPSNLLLTPPYQTLIHPDFYRQPIILEDEPDQEFLGFQLELDPFEMIYQCPTDVSQILSPFSASPPRVLYWVALLQDARSSRKAPFHDIEFYKPTKSWRSFTRKQGTLVPNWTRLLHVLMDRELTSKNDRALDSLVLESYQSENQIDLLSVLKVLLLINWNSADSNHKRIFDFEKTQHFSDSATS